MHGWNLSGAQRANRHWQSGGHNGFVGDFYPLRIPWGYSYGFLERYFYKYYVYFRSTPYKPIPSNIDRVGTILQDYLFFTFPTPFYSSNNEYNAFKLFDRLEPKIYYFRVTIRLKNQPDYMKVKWFLHHMLITYGRRNEAGFATRNILNSGSEDGKENFKYSQDVIITTEKRPLIEISDTSGLPNYNIDPKNYGYSENLYSLPTQFVVKVDLSDQKTLSDDETLAILFSGVDIFFDYIWNKGNIHVNPVTLEPVETTDSFYSVVQKPTKENDYREASYRFNAYESNTLYKLYQKSKKDYTKDEEKTFLALTDLCFSLSVQEINETVYENFEGV